MNTIINGISLKPPHREIPRETSLERARRIHEEFHLHDRYRRAVRASKGATPGNCIIATGLLRKAVLAVDWTDSEDVNAFYQIAGRAKYAAGKMRQLRKAEDILRTLRAKGLVVEES